jgi:formylglycine-generating enzyme required for sulfatase activity
VTEGDYKRFLNEVNAKPRDDGPGSRGSQLDRYPVTSITWREANDYAEHYDKRIPTLYEWEKAARGTEGRKFPWGNTFHATCGRLRITKENSEEDGPSPIGSFPDGASPFGVLDMAGNVLEWTCSARRAGERLFRAVKGACFKDGSPDLARCTSVQYLDPEQAEPFVGFRCVKDVE